jgi:hypothetical protein
MKKLEYIYLLLGVIIVMAGISCSSKEKKYNEKLWLEALKKQKILHGEPEKVAEFEEQYKYPSILSIDSQNLYIIKPEDMLVNIYTGKDIKFVAKFGGKGEGPGEFRVIQGFQVYEDFIFVNSMGKNSYFSKQGDLQKETRFPPHLIPCYPLGNQFVTYEFSGLPTPDNPDSSIKIALIGPKFETKRVLFQKKMKKYNTIFNEKSGQNEQWLFPNDVLYRIYKDNIYIGYLSTESFLFMVFDSQGNKLYEIKRPYLKRRIPDLIKQAIRKRQKKINENLRIKMKINFNEYFPSFCSFEVTDDKIFVFLFPTVESQRIIVMDLKGKLLEVNLIPFDLNFFETKAIRNLFYNKVYDGKKYFLKDNFETQKWELWSLKICECNNTN